MIASPKGPRPRFCRVVLSGLLFLIVLGVPSIHAQPGEPLQSHATLDLSGIWDSFNGLFLNVKISQNGQKLIGTAIDLSKSHSESFQSGQKVFEGTIQGNQIHGKAYWQHGMNMKQACGNAWSGWIQKSYSISPDGNEFTGRWKFPVIDNACKEIRSNEITVKWVRRVKAREVRIISLPAVADDGQTSSKSIQEVAPGDSFIVEVLYDQPPGRFSEVSIKSPVSPELKVRVFQVPGTTNLFRSEPVKVAAP